MSYYKQLDFDPKKRLQIQYRGQPAVDTGGVTRQFFTKSLEVVCDKFFSGSVYKSPIYSPNIAASAIMRHLGTVFYMVDQVSLYSVHLCILTWQLVMWMWPWP